MFSQLAYWNLKASLKTLEIQWTVEDCAAIRLLLLHRRGTVLVNFYLMNLKMVRFVINCGHSIVGV